MAILLLHPEKNALIYGGDYHQKKKIAGLPENFTVIIPQLPLPLNWLSDGFVRPAFSQFK